MGKVLNKISIIVAMSSNGVIGDKGGLLWHIKKDMESFKQITMGHTVVMGYNTYMSLPKQKPLKGRRNIILSSRLKDAPEGFEVAHHIEEVLDMIKNDDQTFVIGGGKVYEQFMDLASFMFVTYVDKEFYGDTVFPEFDRDEWELVRSQEIDDDPAVDFTYYFLDFRRKQE
jgi:dihydrofolate reductase